MKILTIPFPIFATAFKLHFSSNLPRLKNTKTHVRVSIEPPPPDFDFRTEILGGSRAAIAQTHPELLDLADDGSLVVIKKSQFGPVPIWRTEFVEPDAIWLIGTAHISQESANYVERVIRAVKPDNVVVELCRSSDLGSKVIEPSRAQGVTSVALPPCLNSIESIFRAGIMYTSTDSDGEINKKLGSSMFSLSGTGFFGAVGRSIDLGGQTALALRILLAAFSSKLSSEVNRPFGDEFRAARKAAEEIGAQMVLGDRPIEITLERAWNSLTLKAKLSLLTSVIGGITSSSDLSAKKLKESSAHYDDNFQLYEQLSFSYPSLLQPLIHERDTYLAWSLKRSKAVNNSKQVVGVIGKGHMNGIIYSLISDQGNLRFRDLVGQRPSRDGTSWVVNSFRSLIRDTVIGILLWLLYEKINAML